MEMSGTSGRLNVSINERRICALVGGEKEEEEEE